MSIVTCVFMVLMPFIMELASRSSQLLVSLAALGCLSTFFLSNLPYLQRNSFANVMSAFSWRVYLKRYEMIGAIVIVSYAFWRSDGNIFGEALLAFIAGACVIVLFRPQISQTLVKLLWLSVVIACAFMLIELSSGMSLRRALGIRWNTFIFNRTLIVIVLLYWPLMYGLMRYLKGKNQFLAMISLTLMVCLALFKGESGAATLAFFGGAFAWGVTWMMSRFSPRLPLLMLTIGLLSAFMLAPVVGDISTRLLSKNVHTALKEGHSQDRVNIWVSFGAAVRDAPILGQGLGSSATMAQRDVAQRIPLENRTMLGVGHPHQMFLQMWVELGVVGVIIALTLIGWWVIKPLAHLISNENLDISYYATCFALLTSIILIALVGHGLWQGWWIAAIGASIAWLKAFSPATESLERESLARQSRERYKL